MPEIQPVQHQPVPVRCRFAMTAADAHSSHEFCVFEFPGCKGCPNAVLFNKTVGGSEDPMKSAALRAWAARLVASPQKTSCRDHNAKRLDR